MRVLWDVSSASVDEVREAIPSSRRGGYNSVQTVLNRLTDRGLVKRVRNGRAYRYSAAVAEAEYLSESVEGLLSRASTAARHAAIANLAGQLSEADFENVLGQLRSKRK